MSCTTASHIILVIDDGDGEAMDTFLFFNTALGLQ